MPTNEPLRIIIAGDHAVVRAGRSDNVPLFALSMKPGKGIVSRTLKQKGRRVQ